MPSLNTARRVSSMKYNGAKTVGQILKEESDFIMEDTWENDIQSKVCYIYDYAHDDQPGLNNHMTYENTTKTKIDAKFIVTQYGSITKDQVAYHLMFRPSQPVEFSPRDELYYFETDYRKRWNVDFPTGLYIDIPNEKSIYEKWLILTMEQGNQFIKYNILPCNYLFEWIETSGQNRYMRRMWGCDRQQLSYDAGTWIDRYINSVNNVEKAYLPLNSITENINYIGEDGKNQRMIISAKVKNPLAWKVTKLENTKPLGIIQLTFSQSEFDQHNDYIEKDSDSNIIGMWADYYTSEIEPSDPEIPEFKPSIHCEITTSTKSLKVGGSYKLLTAKIYDSSNVEQTASYLNGTFTWQCYLDDEDYTDKVIWLSQKDSNKIKIKFPDERSCLGKVLDVKCTFSIDESSLVATLPLELVI